MEIVQGKFLCKMTKHAPLLGRVTYKRGICAAVDGSPNMLISQRIK